MKILRSLALGSGFTLLAALPAWSATPPPAPGKSTSDLIPPVKRQQTVDKATHLTRTPVPAPVPADLNQPFNPTGFDAPDPEEQRANQAAGVRPTPGSGAPQPPAGPATDRELLEAIAARVKPSGSTVFRGKPLLMFPGTKRVSEGQAIIVQYPPVDGRDYEIEVIAITNNSFTLRFRGIETTRPINPTK